MGGEFNEMLFILLVRMSIGCEDNDIGCDAICICDGIKTFCRG